MLLLALLGQNFHTIGTFAFMLVIYAINLFHLYIQLRYEIQNIPFNIPQN